MPPEAPTVGIPGEPQKAGVGYGDHYQRGSDDAKRVALDEAA